MRRVPIRLKLAAALSIPLVALGVVTALEVLKSADDVAQIREQTDLAEAAIGPSGLITSLQNERTWPAIDLIGQGGAVNVTVSGYDETRADTDEALAEFRDELESKDESIANAFRPALDQLAELEQLRADVDANVAAVNPRTIANNIEFSHSVFDRYTALIEPFFDATTRISLVIDDPELRQGTEMADAAARQVEVMSILLNGVISDFTISENGINTSAEITEHSITHANFERNAATMLAGTGPYAQIAADHFPAALTDRVNDQVNQAITANVMDINVMLDAVNVPREEGYFAYQEAVAAEIVDRGETLNSAAEARQRWFVALAVLVLGTAIFLTWLVSRSITKPLRSLTREAKEMAERRLPDAVIDILETPLGDDVVMPSVEPVRLETRDEVADVSAALNTVQDTALDLAVEQAVLRRNIADSFVNLGRRNQNLLGRQLDFITELETNETDADTLANLFRLDHLATRMRRNAESLLVLAGIEPPRKWAAPVRLTDVIRAALGEVEDYQRVTVRGVEPATILGSAAADLAHLLAELIENALVFSPPDQTVDIRGRNRPARAATGAGDTSGYTLAIIDSGLGMPPGDVTAANRRLAGAESFTIAPSKYLGHYVAGNLAARHGITVHLDNSPGNGITATIDIPPTLLTADNALPHADEPHAARDVWPPAPIGTPQPALPLPTGRPASPTAPLPAATHENRYADLPQNGPGSPMAFPRADFGQTGPVPTVGAGGANPWPDPTPAPGPTPEPPWFSSPMAPAAEAAAPPPLSGGLARRIPTDDPGGEARRTPSGLVKRTPRVVDTGEMRAIGRGPDDDLLTSLGRYTGNHQPTRPAADTPAPPAPPHQPATAPTWATSTPPPPRDSSPFSAPAPRPPAGAGLGGLAAGLSGVSPFRGPQESPPPGRGPDVSAPPDRGPDVSGPIDGSPTSGGLTRRVRGAQLPSTNPVSLRRGPATPEAAPTAPGPATPRPRTSEQKQSADAVYSFLSSFTAGVQRGLDDSRTDRPPQL